MKKRLWAVASGVALGSIAFANGGNDSAVDKQDITEAGMPMLEQSAAPYIYLRDDIQTIEGMALKSAKTTRDAHHRLNSHLLSPEMEQAFVAYAALIAADTEKFVSAIEKKTKGKKNRAAFVEALNTDPVMVRKLDGADEAMDHIMEVLARDATRISALGDRYIDEAYAMQKSTWARKKLPKDGMSRVRGAKEWASSRDWPAVDTRSPVVSKAGVVRPNLVAGKTWTTDWSSAGVDPKPASTSGALMTRSLVLAARYAIGDLDAQHLNEYAISRPTKKCLRSAQLNFDQCIAATRTPFEEAFCVGTHGLHDMSRCVGWPAGAGAPAK